MANSSGVKRTLSETDVRLPRANRRSQVRQGSDQVQGERRVWATGSASTRRCAGSGSDKSWAPERAKPNARCAASTTSREKLACHRRGCQLRNWASCGEGCVNQNLPGADAQENNGGCHPSCGLNARQPRMTPARKSRCPRRHMYIAVKQRSARADVCPHAIRWKNAGNAAARIATVTP